MINLLKTARTLILAAMLGLALAGPSNAFAPGNETTLKNAGDVKWELMLPELGKDSPRYTILRVDSRTNATTLMIEFPTAIHIPRHTHDKSETHFLLKGSHIFGHEGKLFHVNEGGYFYMDGGMVHEAWVPAGAKASSCWRTAGRSTGPKGPPPLPTSARERRLPSDPSSILLPWSMT